MARSLFRFVFAFFAVVALSAVGHGQQPAPQTGGMRQFWPQRPGPSPVLDLRARPLPPQGAPAEQRVFAPEPDYVPNEVLVQFQGDASEGARAAARAAVGAVEPRGMRAAGGRLERLPTTLPVPDAVAILARMPQVEFAEPNFIVRHYATSNDPYYTGNLLWGMYGDATAPSNAFGSGAGELWAGDSVGSSDVYVAVIDEGIDLNHPDLAPNIWTNPFDPANGVDDDGNGRIDDVHGWDFFENNNSVYDGSAADTNLDSHGTHVAGTIGARGGNGAGVAGVNWNVTIIATKFLGPVDGTTAAAIEALEYITDLKTRHGLNIVAANNSWGGGGASQALHQAIIRAAKQGILFVAAAGNGGGDGIGDNNDAVPHYPSSYSTLVAAGSETPASYEAVISVASITSTGERSGFSNFGATSVDLGAPGSGIYSTWPQGGYQVISGTSMATPHVTGAAALYKSLNPAASAEQIRAAILSQVVPTASLAGATVTGGRLDVGKFATSGPPPSLQISDVFVTEGNTGTTTANFALTVSNPSTAAISVSYATADGSAVSGRFSNGTPVTIPSSGNGAPYPSTLSVPGGLGTITTARVTLRGFSHTWPDDVDVLLAGPGGQSVVLMSDVGSGADAVNLSFTFSDAASASLPIGSPLASGTFRPTDNGPGDPFAAPAPGGPHAAALSVFDGTDPEGTWRLFVVDDFGGDSGSFSGGWSLELSTTSGIDFAAASGVLTLPPGATSALIPITIYGDVTREADETFTVTLSAPVGAVLADAVGVATIGDDDPLVFTDPVLSGIAIKAVHIAELRDAVNAARVRRGLPVFAFTDALIAGTTPIRALHLVELRAALAEVYAAAGVQPPVYTDPTIVPGVTPARAAHITELRAAVLAAP